jgi:hypothetical protein
MSYAVPRHNGSVVHGQARILELMGPYPAAILFYRLYSVGMAERILQDYLLSET